MRGELRILITALCGLLLLGGCGDEGTPPEDTFLPAQVDDLTVVSVGDSTLTLRWTNTGDDGMEGTAERYDLRYQATQLIMEEWEYATPVSPLPPVGPPGELQEVTIGGIPRDQTFYFALRMVDEAGNISLISNQVTARLGEPLCEVQPVSLQFGDTPVGTEFDMEFVIRNSGSGTLEGQVAAQCSDFEIVDGEGPFSLRAGRTQTVTVRFHPASAGSRNCTISTGTECGDVECTGAGVAADLNLIRIDVTGGSNFMMGSPEDEPGRDPDDEEQHWVTLTRSFWVSDHEVTQAEWRALMSWDESEFPGADRPVDSVTWFDAVEYCNRLSVEAGLEQAYDMGEISRDGNHIVQAEVVWVPNRNGYRLLTEAEWEYICRAGSEEAFHTGAITQFDCETLDPNLDPVGWYCANSGRASRPVRGKAANAFALYDLHGNVFEWCFDFYAEDYGAGDQPDWSDPTGPAQGISRVVRGGAWLSNPQECRSAYRLFDPPGGWFSHIGFRVARNDL